MYLSYYSGRTPESIFSFVFGNENIASEARVLSFFPPSFQCFALNFGEDVARLNRANAPYLENELGDSHFLLLDFKKKSVRGNLFGENSLSTELN